MIPQHKEAGFTLVEMMTVLVIIGLMSAAVVLTLPPSVPDTEKQIDQLTFELNALSQDSVISGEMKAWALSEDDFAFLKYRDTIWSEDVQRDWPDGTSLRLSRDGADVNLTAERQPLIFFEPTGLSTVFELTLRGDAQNYVLSSDGDGRVAMKVSP